MEYAIGIVLALAVSGLATAAGFDRDRAFYPVLAMVIASYYGLFAIMGGSAGTLMAESAVLAAFVLISILGFKLNLWLIVAALFAHGVFDFLHARLIPNPGVPAWWPGFCLTYDVAAAGYLAWILRSRLEARHLDDAAAARIRDVGLASSART